MASKHRKTCSRRLLLLLILGATLIVTVLIHRHLVTSTPSKKTDYLFLSEVNQKVLKENSTATKYILMEAFPSYYELVSGPKHFVDFKCNSSCAIVLDSKIIQEVDSVVVYSQGPPKISPWRSPKQVWVFFAVESPINSAPHFASSDWHNTFNWTMTYRRDSEFYFGYGDFVKLSGNEVEKNFTQLIDGKSKLVAWFVSHCKTQSKRELRGSALQEFIPVDVYGGCGKLKCDRQGHTNCLNMLSTDYYFYLSFENSLCKDYVTEKLYSIMKKSDVVPVVYGGANYSSLLPNNSFIDISHFDSIKSLANYLQKVAGDKTLYASYLKWKNEWRVIEPTPFPFCEFCWRLHHPEGWERVHSSIDRWWREGICHKPPAIVKG